METRDPKRLMTCRYCILHELGHCRKVNPMQNEPRYLRLANGTTMRLVFDCKNCQMLIERCDTPTNKRINA